MVILQVRNLEGIFASSCCQPPTSASPQILLSPPLITTDGSSCLEISLTHQPWSISNTRFWQYYSHLKPSPALLHPEEILGLAPKIIPGVGAPAFLALFPSLLPWPQPCSGHTSAQAAVPSAPKFPPTPSFGSGFSFCAEYSHLCPIYPFLGPALLSGASESPHAPGTSLYPHRAPPVLTQLSFTGWDLRGKESSCFIFFFPGKVSINLIYFKQYLAFSKKTLNINIT